MVLSIGMSIHGAIRADTAIQWLLLVVSATCGVLAFMLLIPMAVGAWPVFGAFGFAGGCLVATGVQGIHYLMTRP